jgi:hypothetical protein
MSLFRPHRAWPSLAPLPPRKAPLLEERRQALVFGWPALRVAGLPRLPPGLAPLISRQEQGRRHLGHSSVSQECRDSVRIQRIPRFRHLVESVTYEERSGGERGIRTLGRVTPTHAFQACAFNHSAISPSGRLVCGYGSKVCGVCRFPYCMRQRRSCKSVFSSLTQPFYFGITAVRQSSVRNGDAGRSFRLNRLAFGSASQAYRTATGICTLPLDTTTVSPSMRASEF